MPLHSGFVCILGRPNAGKSTLLNALVGEKLAIISPKPQTTRNRIQGVLNIPKQKGRAAAQIVLIDTPGVHKPDSSLGRKMMTEVREGLEGCDLLLMIVDVKQRPGVEDKFLVEMVKQRNAGGAAAEQSRSARQGERQTSAHHCAAPATARVSRGDSDLRAKKTTDSIDCLM